MLSSHTNIRDLYVADLSILIKMGKNASPDVGDEQIWLPTSPELGDFFLKSLKNYNIKNYFSKFY